MCLLVKACVVAAQLTHGGLYSIENQLPKVAESYDGVKRDVSRFYEEKNQPFYVGGFVILDTNTRINLTFNSGVDTDKLDIGKSVKVGIKQYERLDENWSIVYGGGVTLGGDVEHSPCKDSYSRSYYCGNLTSWSDFGGNQSNSMPYEVSVKLKYTF